MADKNDVVILELDRPRILWFGHRALKSLVAMTGKSLSQMGEMIGEGDPEDIEKIMYCALLTDAKRNGETLKLSDMEDLLDHAPYGEITEKMELAMMVAFPEPELEEKNSKGTAKK